MRNLFAIAQTSTLYEGTIRARVDGLPAATCDRRASLAQTNYSTSDCGLSQPTLREAVAMIHIAREGGDVTLDVSNDAPSPDIAARVLDVLAVGTAILRGVRCETWLLILAAFDRFEIGPLDFGFAVDATKLTEAVDYEVDGLIRA